MKPPRVERSRRAGAIVCVFLLATGCGSRLPDPPASDSDQYREAIAAFYVGLAALQTGADVLAEEKLDLLTRVAPSEAAGWANFGLLALRQREFDVAQGRFDKARDLAPEVGHIRMLLGLLESTRGRSEAAIEHFRNAVDLDADDLKAKYALAQEMERLGGTTNEVEAARVYQALAAQRPENLEVLLEVARLAAKRGDSAALQNAVNRIGELSGTWPPEILAQLDALRAAASGSDSRAAGTRVAFLRNVLLRTPDYRESLAAVKTPPTVAGEPLLHPLWLPPATPTPAPIDEALRFVSEPLGGVPPGPCVWAGALVLESDATPTPVVASTTSVRVGDKVDLPFPGTASDPRFLEGVLGFDASYDFRTDLLLAGASGVGLYVRDGDGGFTNATEKMKLPAQVAAAAYVGAWAADLESDGDLDAVLAARDGAPVALRNNGDGTFAPLTPFDAVVGLRGFAWGDFDEDGDGDAALLDAVGTVRVYRNERLGQFRASPLPDLTGPVVAITVGDADRDGRLDLIALRNSGALVSVASAADGEGWLVREHARYDGGNVGLFDGTVRLFAQDFDNNGGLDVIASGGAFGRLWLGDPKGNFTPLDALPPERVTDVADVSGDGRLDLICVSADGRPLQAINRGTKDYGWIELRPRAKEVTGDQRVNPFGVGGEVEVRCGLLAQKRPVAGPWVHFGIGKYATADVARVVWPNGAMQAEFDLAAGTPLHFDQRLEGSCPWLFAWDGNAMRFVTDLIWRSPLGLRINAQDTGRVTQTEDWVKIRGDQLVARDGYYDLRITAELWETHFFDHLSLMVVDHPANTDVFVDERFAIPPPTLALHATGPARPVAGAWDDLGQDVSEVVRMRDGRYLDTFGRGQYQGVTRDHYVEVEIGDDAPREGPLWLVASGWLHPTDSSINVAIGQGTADPPRGLSLEVADGKGGWIAVGANLGFPAGKLKTILVPLDGVFPEGAPRRIRLRTNLEIFWDSLAWAAGSDATVDTRRIGADFAELRYRGYSLVTQADTSSPELPEYDRIVSTAQRWPDLIGYHTRFGEVLRLVTEVDDRYVIMNAGDELALRFPAPPPPPNGWVRDFVLVGDGWVKDGNFNTTFSKTVLPLPLHGRPEYDTPPGRLEDDPAYRLHPEDWREYHTRYVTPRELKRALWSTR